MNSPLSSLIRLSKGSRTPIYSQLTTQLLELIRNGQLAAGHKLPSTREFAKQLQIHRKTIVRVYEDLLAQGWLESHTGSGTFVAVHLPELKPTTLQRSHRSANPKTNQTNRVAGFPIPAGHIQFEDSQPHTTYHLDDGFPDTRLAPLEELSRAYRRQLLTGNTYERLGYNDPCGSRRLREQLSIHLNETRGLNTTPDNILIIRGSVMGVHLTCAGLIQPKDLVVTCDLSWRGADYNFMQAGAKLIKVSADAYGLRIDELERLCRREKVRMVYITSHHHYPTTVPLRAERRIELLRLSEQYANATRQRR